MTTWRQTRLGGALARLWEASPPLTATGLLMIPLLAAAAAGLWLDPRVITGAPAWLKPAKFAASIGIYTLTLAWVFTHLPAWRSVRAVVGWTTAVTLIGEIVIIGLQAWRGTTSHFNVATPLDATLFTVMGLAIVVQTLAAIAAAVVLWRQRFADRALGWALRLGLTLTIVGAMAGGLMTRPTEAQLAAAATGPIAVAGAHTVGAPDGGAGLPGTGWSTTHGDLRVAHFVGLHAIQMLPLLLMAFPRQWPDPLRLRMIAAAAGSYAMLFVILLWQALRGEPLVAPGDLTRAVLALWVAATAAACLAARRDGPAGARAHSTTPAAARRAAC